MVARFEDELRPFERKMSQLTLNPAGLYSVWLERPTGLLGLR